MPKTSFDIVWDRITAYEGRVFFTITRKEFKYKIHGNGFYPSRTKYRLSKNNFREAYNKMPIKGPGAISKTVRGPSYVWAILNDPRILS